MSKKRSGGATVEGIKARGFFRIQINEEGKVMGDTGWQKNQVTNDGILQYLCLTLAGSAGSKSVSHALLGTGGAPAAADTGLAGEITDVAGTRCAVTPSTIASKTVQFAFTLASGVYTAPHNIANVALINHSSTATAGTIFAGNTFASSALASNQAVQGSYQIRFS